ncbi:MAG: DUF6428 family protein [Pseudomonadota bacterium]
MTLADLLTSLNEIDPNAALIFQVEGQDIGAGYHVTELRHSASTGIDCGGRIDRWEEARLQLLDGHGGKHMSVGKFVSIVSRSIDAVPGLANVPLLVEYAPGNRGLSLLEAGRPVERDGLAALALHPTRAVCKPAEQARGAGQSAIACCGASDTRFG